MVPQLIEHGKLAHILKMLCQMHSCKNKLFALCSSFISALLKNNNHYLTDVKINRDVGYYYLK